jgi:hypothetical protein
VLSPMGLASLIHETGGKTLLIGCLPLSIVVGGAMTTNAPESRLLAALGTANEWVRFGEVKNGALLTLNGAMLIGAHQLLNWNTQRPFSVDAWLWIASGFWIASILVGLASFYSRTKTFGFDFGIGRQEENANSIFFGHIADMTREQVLKRLAVDCVADAPQRWKT